MNLKTETITIDNMKFYINQFMARKSIRMEKKTIQILAPMLGILEEFKNFKGLDSNINLTPIIKGIQDTLNNLSDNDFESYIEEMFEMTSVELKNEDGKGVKTLSLANMNNFDMVFIGKTLTVYKLILEVMRVNSFCFFELVGGKGLNLTGLFPTVK